MTWALNSSKFASKPIQLLRITIGGTPYRYAQLWIDVTEGGVRTPYQGRILRFGVSDRALTYPGPTIGDLTVELDNKDGSLSGLLTAFTDGTKNIIRAKAEVLRGFAGDDVNTEFQTVATFQFGELVEVNDRHTISLKFTDQADDLFGELQPPTARTVLKALVSAFSATFSGLDRVREMDETLVPMAAGFWGAASPVGCLPEVEVAATKGTTHIYLCAVMPWTTQALSGQGKRIWFSWTDVKDVSAENEGQDVANNLGGRYRWRVGDWAGFEEGAGTLGGDNGGATVLASYDLTATEGYHVLVLRTTRILIPGAEYPFRPAARVPLFPNVDGAGRHNPRPVELIKDVVATFNSKGRTWSGTYVDTASFIKVDDLLRSYCRVFIPGTVTAMDHAQKIAAAFLMRLYYNSVGKLAAWAPEYEGGDSPAYVSAPRLTEGQELLSGSLRAAFGRDGQPNGLVNRVEVTYRGSWHIGDLVVAVDNADSQMDHGRVVTAQAGGEVILGHISAHSVGARRAYLSGNPRMVVTARLPFGVSDYELGDIVHLTTKAVPGFSTGKLCIVEGIRPDLDRYDTTLVLADWDAELNAKVYLIPDEADFIRLSRQSGETLDVTASSTTLEFQDVDFSSVVEWDIVDCRCWDTTVRVGGDNEFRGVVDSVTDMGLGWWRIVLKTGSGMGQLPDTNETGITDWRILFSSETCAASLDKYGKVAHSNALLNSGTPYVWRPV